MEDMIKKYMDFWEVVTHETLFNPKITAQWQSLMQGYGEWMKGNDSSHDA